MSTSPDFNHEPRNPQELRRELGIDTGHDETYPGLDGLTETPDEQRQTVAGVMNLFDSVSGGDARSFAYAADGNDGNNDGPAAAAIHEYDQRQAADSEAPFLSYDSQDFDQLPIFGELITSEHHIISPVPDSILAAYERHFDSVPRSPGDSFDEPFDEPFDKPATSAPVSAPAAQTFVEPETTPTTLTSVGSATLDDNPYDNRYHNNPQTRYANTQGYTPAEPQASEASETEVTATDVSPISAPPAADEQAPPQNYADRRKRYNDFRSEPEAAKAEAAPVPAGPRTPGEIDLFLERLQGHDEAVAYQKAVIEQVGENAPNLLTTEAAELFYSLVEAGVRTGDITDGDWVEQQLQAASNTIGADDNRLLYEFEAALISAHHAALDPNESSPTPHKIALDAYMVTALNRHMADLIVQAVSTDMAAAQTPAAESLSPVSPAPAPVSTPAPEQAPPAETDTTDELLDKPYTVDEVDNTLGGYGIPQLRRQLELLTDVNDIPPPILELMIGDNHRIIGGVDTTRALLRIIPQNVDPGLITTDAWMNDRLAEIRQYGRDSGESINLLAAAAALDAIKNLATEHYSHPSSQLAAKVASLLYAYQAASERMAELSLVSPIPEAVIGTPVSALPNLRTGAAPEWPVPEVGANVSTGRFATLKERLQNTRKYLPEGWMLRPSQLVFAAVVARKSSRFHTREERLEAMSPGRRRAAELGFVLADTVGYIGLAGYVGLKIGNAYLQAKGLAAPDHDDMAWHNGPNASPTDHSSHGPQSGHAPTPSAPAPSVTERGVTAPTPTSTTGPSLQNPSDTTGNGALGENPNNPHHHTGEVIHIKSGDNLTEHARIMIQAHTGKPATQAQVNDVIKDIAKENGLKDPNQINVGDLKSNLAQDRIDTYSVSGQPVVPENPPANNNGGSGNNGDTLPATKTDDLPKTSDIPHNDRDNHPYHDTLTGDRTIDSGQSFESWITEHGGKNPDRVLDAARGDLLKYRDEHGRPIAYAAGNDVRLYQTADKQMPERVVDILNYYYYYDEQKNGN